MGVCFNYLANDEWPKNTGCLCDLGERITGIRSKFDQWFELGGVDYRDDRIMTFDCTKISGVATDQFEFPRKIALMSKPEELFLWDGFSFKNGDREETDAFMVGLSTILISANDDRMYFLYYSKMTDMVPDRNTCSEKITLNAYEQNFEYMIGDDEVITYFESHFNYLKEDRIFQIKKCKLRKKCEQLIKITYHNDQAAERKTYNFVGVSKRTDARNFSSSIVESNLKITLSDNREYDESYRFDYESGYQNNESLKVRAGVNWGLNGLIKLQYAKDFSTRWSTYQTWTRQQSKRLSESLKREATCNINCKPGCLCVQNYTMAVGQTAVPYTLLSKDEEKDRYCIERGTMREAKNLEGECIPVDYCGTN